MIGTIVNTATIVVGGIIGALLHRGIKEKYKEVLYTGLGLASLAIGLNATRVYVAATDLFTISNWSGIDPENAGTIAANAGSDRYGSNGAYKTVTVGVNLTF